MKDKRTDKLLPQVATVINVKGQKVKVQFDSGKVFTSDKSHFKILNNGTDEKKKE
jgi:hypothetical protein